MKQSIQIAFMCFLLGSCASKKAVVSKAPNAKLTQQNTTSTVTLSTGIVKVPGLWQHLNFEKSSGQQYLQNGEGVIVAVAMNPKKAYPFYKSGQTGYETIEAFTNWDIAFQNENNRETKILKKEPQQKFQIWKFKDDKNIDNVFLYGSAGDKIINLLVYTNSWTEIEKMEFLEKAFIRNRIPK